MDSLGALNRVIVTRRNLTRHGRWGEEQAALRPLPATQLALCREERAMVSRRFMPPERSSTLDFAFSVSCTNSSSSSVRAFTSPRGIPK